MVEPRSCCIAAKSDAAVPFAVFRINDLATDRLIDEAGRLFGWPVPHIRQFFAILSVCRTRRIRLGFDLEIGRSVPELWLNDNRKSRKIGPNLCSQLQNKNAVLV